MRRRVRSRLVRRRGRRRRRRRRRHARAAGRGPSGSSAPTTATGTAASRAARGTGRATSTAPSSRAKPRRRDPDRCERRGRLRRRYARRPARRTSPGPTMTACRWASRPQRSAATMDSMETRIAASATSACGRAGRRPPEIVGKSHIIQVTNIGYDATGDHSFDIPRSRAAARVFSIPTRAAVPGGLFGATPRTTSTVAYATAAADETALPAAIRAASRLRVALQRLVPLG